jgi:SAM-dependent methyltransferase
VIRSDKDENLDQDVIDGFGREWAAFDYVKTNAKEALDNQFKAYCSPIDLAQFNSESAVAADIGAGSGRWSERLLPYFSLVYVLEPSDGAISVLETKFSNEPRIKILQESVGANSIPDTSLDLAMSLGVLHHIPNTALAIREISSKIKSGGTFLFYRLTFKVANLVRWVVSRLPYFLRKFIAQVIASLAYLPLARLTKLLIRLGKDVSNFPLHHYADMPFVMLQNDALDRFGTRLEQRFSKKDIAEMLKAAEFDISTLKFSELEPFWTFSVKKG